MHDGITRLLMLSGPPGAVGICPLLIASRVLTFFEGHAIDVPSQPTGPRDEVSSNFILFTACFF